MPDLIPDSFAELVRDRPADELLGALPDRAGQPRAVDGATWLDGLPALLDRLLQDWRLRVDGPSRHGECALVVPVRRHTGEAAALKVTMPHAEARHEHLALRAWDGRGAVRLLSADPVASALLLERLDADRCLRDRPLLEACEVVGLLMRDLDRPALPRIDTVATKAQRWAEQLSRGTPLVPRRLIEQAASTLPDLLTGTSASLVHEDLHDLNVLAPLPDATNRGDWLAIDPKPVAAEWAYAVAPVVWNRAEEAARASNLRTHARLRADVVAEAAGLDEDRVRAWTFVRLVLNAVWAAPHAPASDDFRARMIALAKAFTD
ncbi:streptomycin 3-kinase (6) [Serinicoccus hydrothermalis]|uniref:Streptomycin 3-kinase (6) n=1 Tax=Serinicoccus hydrothermalis TaxID=1758689 RepID=A0A1B1NDL3_9MICO|nr:aminoglycoside phosphotransferase family protein [Serinicoccus hydrothermalis]ANS79529.1 streptomycin 3-kinase (6) [Serinicoccus hydrothermalis]